MHHTAPIRIAALLAAMASLSACSLFPDSTQTAHLGAESVQVLEVPPDLSTPDQSGQFIIPGDQGGALARNMLLPALESVKLVRDGRVSWLEFDTAPENLWPLLRRFFPQEGFPLQRDEPLAGLLVTQWVESRNEPGKSGLAKLLEVVMLGIGDTGLRDSFVLRLERTKANTTRLFLRHRGLEEVVTSSERSVEDQIETAWTQRPRDLDLEVRMQQRLLVFLGLEEQRASGVLSEADARKIIDVAYVDVNDRGERFLFIGQTEELVWPKLEDALSSIGFDVDDEVRNAGRISVSRYGELHKSQEKIGTLAKLFSTDEELKEYHVFLGPQAAGSRISLRDLNGERLNDEEEQFILNALQGEFR